MSLKISRILHAGYIFELGETRIVFDPIFENPFSRNCYAFPPIEFDQESLREQKFSAVFISHYHDDHCSMESLHLLDRNTPIYMYCLHDEMFDLIRQLGFANVQSLAINQSVIVGDLEIIPRKALDEDVDSLFQIKGGGVNVLNVVDSWIDYTTLDLLKNEAPWDMILWPFQTMRELDVIAPSRAPVVSLSLPPEWLEQIGALKPKYIVPSSCQFIQEPWSWYNYAFFPITYKQFSQEILELLPQAQVIRLNPGISIELDKGGVKPAASLSWIRPLGDQNVDYDFQSSVIPPPTSDIARNFPGLSPSQKSKVMDFCHQGLIEKFASLEPSLDDFFQKPRRWRLSLYDEKGQGQEFHYLLEGSKMELIPANSQISLAWATEVPIFKLYAALEMGESLTSMYIRINDVTFCEPVEEEIATADIVEDPLIRCLFNGVFGSYQKAQLRKLGAGSADTE